MKVVDVVRSVMSEQMSLGIALKDLQELIDEGLVDHRLLQMGRQGRRFLSRWRDYLYGQNKISDEDLLMALRDTVLWLGKLPAPVLLRNLVEKKGNDFGLYVETSGDIAAIVSEPGWYVNDHYVRQCYGLDDIMTMRRPDTPGDRLLYQSTGFKNYKSFEQKVAIHTAVNLPEGFTLLVTLSTGEGKSTITQMTVACDRGLTVLVVPTTALGKDQYRAAVHNLAKVVPAEKIYDFCGGQTEHYQDLKKKLDQREIKLLITSPEAIVKNTQLREQLTWAAENAYLTHLVIDEAHIVQDWGATFRPDFQFLSMIRRELLKKSEGKLKTILLSATLSNQAVDELRILFSEVDKGRKNWIPIRCDSLRTEIRYMVDPISRGKDIQETQRKKVLRYVRTLPKPMLIYTIQPKVAKEWQKYLRENGICNTVVFSGLTDDDERTEIIKRWNEDDLDIVIATSAFGMGIDKPDVRTVIHVTMPESINRFYQEVGRGGRDGLPSISLLCYCPSIDHHQQVNITHRKIMTGEKLMKRWLEMARDPYARREADVIEVNTRMVPKYFTKEERENSGNRNRDWNLHTILFMVRHGYLDFVDLHYLPETGDYNIKVRLRDLRLLEDPDAMSRQVETDRDTEYDASDREFKVFIDMVDERKEHCFAESFSKIYTLAEMDCGGCAQHLDEHFISSRFRLHSFIPYYVSQGITDLPYKIWHDVNCLMVSQETRENTVNEISVALCMNKAGVSTWVQYDSKELREKAVDFPGLVLTREEAEEVLVHHPSLLGQAVLVTLGSNSWENQRLLAYGLKLIDQGLAVVFHMKTDTVYEASGRTLDQFQMCHIIRENELM
ncbi:ATP-dependent DNA helicase RecQ [Clostridiales bacterium FE2011]|nr:ATP-dependent DNA helicase RecQ [Clostridiales bacterium FE2011]